MSTATMQEQDARGRATPQSVERMLAAVGPVDLSPIIAAALAKGERTVVNEAQIDQKDIGEEAPSEELGSFDQEPDDGEFDDYDR